MITITITGMTIEIPDEVGALHGLLGAVTQVTGAVNTPIKVQLPAADTEAEKEEEPDTSAADEMAQKRSEAAKKAAETKKANAEKAAAAEAKAAAVEAKAAALAAAAMEEEVPAEGDITPEMVKAEFKRLIDKKIDIIAILAQFGATKVSGLDKSRYADVMAHITGL